MKIKLIKDVMRSPSIKFKKGDILVVVWSTQHPLHKKNTVYYCKEYGCYIFKDECRLVD